MNRTLFSIAAIFGALMPLVFDSALKGAVLLAIAALVALALWRASAAARHLVWLVAIVALLFVPVLSLALPQWRVLPRWAGGKVAVLAENRPNTPYKPNRPYETLPAAEPLPEFTEAPAPTGKTIVAPAAPAPLPAIAPALPAPTWREWLPLAWCIGFAVLAVRLLAAHLLLRRASRRCPALTSPPDEKIAAAFADACKRLGVRQRVTLLLDEKRTIPVVWGVFRPRLMLPVEAREWSDEQLYAVLLHEVGHIKRRDTLVQWLTQIACALHWWNPLVWLAAWRLHAERERACDDLVLASGIRPSAYAGHLLDVATRLSPARWTSACGLAMARKSSLEGRLTAVLSSKRNRSGVTRALAAAALLLGAGIAIPVAMLRAADEKWNPPHAAHIGSNDFSTYCVHDGKNASFVIAYRGDFGSASDHTSNSKARTWYDDVKLTLKTKNGKREVALRREYTAPNKLMLAGKDYDLVNGRVFLVSDNAEVIRQLPMNSPAIHERAGADALAKQIAAIPPQVHEEIVLKPKHEYAQSLFRKWQARARVNGTIPGALIGQLAVATDKAVKELKEADVTAKLAALRPRMDSSRDWEQAEVVALLDEVSAISIAPAGWADLPLDFESFEDIKAGQPLPKELESAAWGAPAENGLRAAWLLEPAPIATGSNLTELLYRLGTVLKARVLFHNAGKTPVVFRTETWHQSDTHTVRDATGADIKVSGTWFSGITPLANYRLLPGEYCEVGAPGIAIGAGKYEDEFSTGSVGSVIEAKVGDEVSLSHVVDAATSGKFTRPSDPKDPGELWKKRVAERVAAEAPTPELPADRELLIRRVMLDIVGVQPTAEEVAQFVNDSAPTSLDALVARIVAQPRSEPWTGKLPTGTTKFRILPADPDAAKKPRAATAPGRYVLGDGVHLQVTRLTENGTHTNTASILFFGPDPKQVSPHKPHDITLPAGLDSYAIVWVRNAGLLMIVERGSVRTVDFSKPDDVKETRAKVNLAPQYRKLLPPGLLGEMNGAHEKPKSAAIKLTPDSLLGAWRGTLNGERFLLSFHRPPAEDHLNADVYIGDATIGMILAFAIEPDGSAVKLTGRNDSVFGRLTPMAEGVLKLDLHGRQQGQMEVTLARDVDAPATEPRQKEPRELFAMWKATANPDGTIPGTFIGRLAAEVRAYEKANPVLYSAESLPTLLRRFVTSRDWTQVEAIKLLDDVASFSTAPIEAYVAKAKLPSDALWRTKVAFEDIPVQIANWSAEKNGLRIGMRVVADDGWRLGGAVKVELWLHNPGAKDVMFKARPERADIGLAVVAKDSEGKDHRADYGNIMLYVVPEACVLPAGHVAKVKDFELSFDAPGNEMKAWMAPRFRTLAPGTYKLRCEWGDANVSASGADFWKGELTSGDVEFTLAAEGAAAAPATSDPGAAQRPAAPEYVTVDIQKDGSISYGRKPVTLDELKTEAAQNAKKWFTIRADKDVPYAKVIEVVEALKAGGVTEFSFSEARVGDGKYRVANRQDSYKLDEKHHFSICRPREYPQFFTVSWPAEGERPACSLRTFPNVSEQTQGKWAVVWEPGTNVLWWVDDSDVGKMTLTDPAHVIVDREGRTNNFSRDFGLPEEVKTEFRRLGFIIGRDKTPGLETAIGGNTGGQTIVSAEAGNWIVEGAVTDADGKPLPNVRVRVTTNQELKTEKTDEKGRYRAFFSLPIQLLARWRAVTVEPVLEGYTERDMAKAGEFNALLRGGEQPQRVRLVDDTDFQPGAIPRFAERDIVPSQPGVSPGNPGRADFVMLKAGEITGEIVTADGRPAPPHWIVAATPEQRPGRNAAIELSDAQGHFRLKGIPTNKPVIFTVNPDGKLGETSKSSEQKFEQTGAHKIRIILPGEGTGKGPVKIERVTANDGSSPKPGAQPGGLRTDVKPEQSRQWNDKYAAVAYQTEKVVNFVLIHEGFISTGLSESYSETSGKWSIEGNIHLVDSKKTQAAGQNVDKRVIALKYTSDAPTKLFLDGKEYGLNGGRTFILSDQGEPKQLEKTIPIRDKADLEKLGDLFPKEPSPGKNERPKAEAQRAVGPVESAVGAGTYRFGPQSSLRLKQNGAHALLAAIAFSAEHRPLGPNTEIFRNEDGDVIRTEGPMEVIIRPSHDITLARDSKRIAFAWQRGAGVLWLREDDALRRFTIDDQWKVEEKKFANRAESGISPAIDEVLARALDGAPVLPMKPAPRAQKAADAKIEPGDVLEVFVTGVGGLTGRYEVDAEGSIKVLGTHLVSGLSPAEATAALAKISPKPYALYGISVTMTLTHAGPAENFVFYLNGEFKNPVTFTAPQNVPRTLLAILDASGGASELGDLASVRVISGSTVEAREGRVTVRHGAAAEITVDVSEIRSGKIPDVPVRNRSIIVIPSLENTRKLKPGDSFTLTIPPLPVYTDAVQPAPPLPNGEMRLTVNPDGRLTDAAFGTVETAGRQLQAIRRELLDRISFRQKVGASMKGAEFDALWKDAKAQQSQAPAEAPKSKANGAALKIKTAPHFPQSGLRSMWLDEANAGANAGEQVPPGIAWAALDPRIAGRMEAQVTGQGAVNVVLKPSRKPILSPDFENLSATELAAEVELMKSALETDITINGSPDTTFDGEVSGVSSKADSASEALKSGTKVMMGDVQGSIVKEQIAEAISGAIK